MTDNSRATCPECRGLGKYSALVRTAREGCKPQVMQCWRCQGTGEIPAETASWTAAGEALRQSRLDRRLSVREEARRLGISPKELSEMEHGRIAPVDYEQWKKMLEQAGNPAETDGPDNSPAPEQERK